MKPNYIILLGGGYSVKGLNALSDGLFLFLQNKNYFGLNYAYKFCDPTLTIGIDHDMYESGEGHNPETHNEISKLPLVVWLDTRKIYRPEPNTIFLPSAQTYDRDLTKGVYRSANCGLFAVSLAIKLLLMTDNPNPRIYLLGFDFGPWKIDGRPALDQHNRVLTHWYQGELEHRGIGKSGWYDQTSVLDQKRVTSAFRHWKPFKTETQVKIYNVGGTSTIPYFEHMTYQRFFHQEFEFYKKPDLRTYYKQELNKIKNGIR